MSPRDGAPPRLPVPPADPAWARPGGPPPADGPSPGVAGRDPGPPGGSAPLGGSAPPGSVPPGSRPPNTPPPPRRRWAFAAAAFLALLVLAAVAHVLWWSWPRPHAALPDPADLPGRLLATERLPVALWIAYPHQNLATLADAVGRDDGADAWLAALARRTDLPATELPAFGPFRAPPSRELAAASDLAGERVVVAARVEPVFAVLSRLAGLVARNAWLAGGEVEAFGGRAEVTWVGTLWIVSNLPLAELLRIDAESLAAPARPILDRPALAAVRLDEPLSLLPAGLHALRADDERLTLSTEAPAAGAAGRSPPPPPSGDAASAPRPSGIGLPDQLLERWGVSLLVLSGPDGPAGGAGAFALFRDVGGARRIGPLTFQVPAAAVWHGGGGGRFSLPGEGLLGLLGGGGGGGRGGGGWRITATGREAQGRAQAIGPSITPLVSRLRLGLWADPRPALATVEEVADFLDAVPLAGREEALRWRDWQVLLAPLAACDRLSIEAWPAAIHLEARGCDN